MSGKHTPGPWDVVSPSHHFGMREVKGPSLTCHGFTIATDVDAEKAERIKADARLIAAAPDLLSIVERFVALPSCTWHPERHAADEAELMADARAAIAKARGEA